MYASLQGHHRVEAYLGIRQGLAHNTLMLCYNGYTHMPCVTKAAKPHYRPWLAQGLF